MTHLPPAIYLYMGNSVSAKRYTIVNGRAGVFELKEYGLSISYGKECLPPSIPECTLSVTATLTTNIAMPSGSSLVSGVYHIKTAPFIEKFNEPVEISMVHCAIVFDQLCFIVASDQTPSTFDYMKGGRFETDAKNGYNIGKIRVGSFSDYCIIDSKSSGCLTYCARVYYDDSEHKCRKVHFVITKNLPLAELVRI